ncbi:hypothetical protein [Candidatus Magnetaquicoccus inordinatus]|uniref:hypothetical protein n=1 Tax=Candidatus Magnetaquicoccus inordinatus TaxID=2496818 RepID=UPI00102C6AEA|nr:hypothetical protein [Candidatus Magnetaquicoccus inordinatus]
MNSSSTLCRLRERFFSRIGLPSWRTSPCTPSLFKLKLFYCRLSWRWRSDRAFQQSEVLIPFSADAGYVDDLPSQEALADEVTQDADIP